MARNADEAAAQAQRRAAEQLAAGIRRIAGQAKAVRSTGFRIPTLAADPQLDDPTNLWFLEDGRLRGRTRDGILHEFAEVAVNRPPVPTFATDPAASTGWVLWFNGGTGRLRGRLANGAVVEFAPVVAASSGDGGTPTSGGTTSTKPKPADPTPVKFWKTYSATWGRTFCPQHGVELGANLRYGTFPGSSHGNRRIMFGLTDAVIRSDFAGATIRQVEIHLRNTDSWDYSGIDIHFGAHNKDTAPSVFSAVRRDAWSGHWPHSGDGDEWRTVHDWFGRALRDNEIKGITVEQPSTSAAYYGELDWSSFKIRITGTK